VKSRANRRSAQISFHKPGREIRGHLKPKYVKKSFVMALDVPSDDGVSKIIEGKDVVED
jgi:hypothetical protein